MGFARLALVLTWLTSPAFAAGGGGIAGCGRRMADVVDADDGGGTSSRRRAAAAVPGGGTPWCGDHWWEEDFEYAFVESYMVVSLVAVALLFEAVHHVAHHKSHRNYVFGSAWDERRHEDKYHEVQHSLMADLTARATSEFTVLGFLAFVIWCVSRGGGFEEVAYRVGPGEEGARLPRSGYEILHMLEDVHMHLFVGMVCYFTFMYQIVGATLRTLQGWESRDIACSLRSGASGLSSLKQLGSVPGHPRFSDWRTYFFASLVNIQDRFPDSWAELEKFCKWRESREPELQANHPTADPDALKQLQSMRVEICLDDWFPFGKFLAMNSRVIVEDMIDFGFTTWFATALLMILSGLLAKFCQASFQVMLPFYVGLTILVLIAICVWFYLWESRITGRHAWRKCLSSLHRKVRIEILVIRLLQVLLFFVSYSTSRMVASRDDWENHFWENIVFVLVFLTLHVALRWGVADIIVHFAGLTSIGEFMDEDNCARLAKILGKRMEGYGQAQLAHLDPHLDTHDHADSHTSGHLNGSSRTETASGHGVDVHNSHPHEHRNDLHNPTNDKSGTEATSCGREKELPTSKAQTPNDDNDVASL